MGKGCYLQVVNGTPYAWNRVDGHKYQMNEAKFADHIPAFTTHTAYIEFPAVTGFAHYRDCEAWVEYNMSGTPYRFRLWANMRNMIEKIKLQLVGMNSVSNHQHDEIDLGFVENNLVDYEFNGVLCIIAGREGAFVTTSGRGLNHGAWMNRALGGIGDRTLREICIPGTHNSGMWKGSWYTKWGTGGNVLNQFRSIKEQLWYGVRLFDIRPALDKDGKWFYVNHISHTSNSIGYQGALGDWIGYIVNDINEFTRENAEVVVLNISHDVNIDAGYKAFTPEVWERLFKEEFDRLGCRYKAEREEDLTRVQLNDLIGEGKAAVIIRFDYEEGKAGPDLGERHGDGYFYRTNFPLFDEYADKNDPEELIKHQVERMTKERNRENPRDGKVFMMNWAMTQKTGDALNIVGPSLLDWARQGMTPRLGVLYDKCFGKCFPNVINLDGVESTDGLAMAFAINEWQTSKR